jgi:hypothetical protein
VLAEKYKDKKHPDRLLALEKYKCLIRTNVDQAQKLLLMHDPMSSFMERTLSLASKEQLNRVPNYHTEIVQSHDPKQLFLAIRKIHIEDFAEVPIEKRRAVKAEYDDLRQGNLTLESYLKATRNALARFAPVGQEMPSDEDIAMDFLEHAHGRYADLLAKLKVNVRKKLEAYPKTLEESYDYLVVNGPSGTAAHAAPNMRMEAAFAARERPDEPPRGCTICQLPGKAGMHWQDRCPQLEAFHLL